MVRSHLHEVIGSVSKILRIALIFSKPSKLTAFRVMAILVGRGPL